MGCSLAWAAYGFAKRWHGRKDVDLKKLQRIVLDWVAASAFTGSPCTCPVPI